jgi:small subunit ribosomal protein S17
MATVRIISSKILTSGKQIQGVATRHLTNGPLSILTTNDVNAALFRSYNVRNEFNNYCTRNFATSSPYPYTDLNTYDMTNLTNQELEDTSTIPGWDLVHSPPRKFPRGALIGKVVSDKMTKTINVAVDRYTIAPKVRKRVRYTKKFMAHDEGEVCRMGDLVMITPSQRISRHKHFMLREIIRPKGQL